MSRSEHPAAYTPSPPTISEVYDDLRDEYDALGTLSYTGAIPDLSREDIEKIRALLRRTGAAIEGLA